MRLKLFAALLLSFTVSITIRTSAFADSTAPLPDKSNYTLFNPTPANAMREMGTDRPDKTDSPITIDAGHLQIETGIFDYTYYRDRYQGDNARIETLNLGEFNFRLGVLYNLELNLIVDSYDFLRITDYQAGQSVRQNGLGDLVLGAKLNIWGNDNGDDPWETALALEPQMKIPTARKDIGNGYPEFSLGVPLLINLPAGFGLALQTTPSCERNSNNNGYVAGWQNSASIDRVIFGTFDVYLEYWSHATTQTHQEAQQTVDFGFTCPVAASVIFDTGVNLGLNRASDSFEITSGLSLRI